MRVAGLARRQQRSNRSRVLSIRRHQSRQSFDSRARRSSAGCSSRLMAIGRFRSSTRRQTSTVSSTEASRSISERPKVFPAYIAPPTDNDRAATWRSCSYRWPAHYQSLGQLPSVTISFNMAPVCRWEMRPLRRGCAAARCACPASPPRVFHGTVEAFQNSFRGRDDSAGVAVLVIYIRWVCLRKA